MDAQPALLQTLTHDLLCLVLLECEFDSILVLLASARQFADAVLVVLQSHAWRTRGDNERQLQLSAWEHSMHVESCLGAFGNGAFNRGRRCTPIGGIDMHGGRVACFRSKGFSIRIWDVADAETICTHAIEQHATLQDGRDGGWRAAPSVEVATVALRDDVLAVATTSGDFWLFNITRAPNRSSPDTDCERWRLTTVSRTQGTDAGVVGVAWVSPAGEEEAPGEGDEALLVILDERSMSVESRKLTLQVWHVPAWGLSESSLRASTSCERVRTPYPSSIDGCLAFAAHSGILAITRCRGPVELYAVPSLELLSSLTAFEGLPSVHLALNSTHLALASTAPRDAFSAPSLAELDAPPAVMLWPLDALLEGSGESTSGGGSMGGDGGAGSAGPLAEGMTACSRLKLDESQAMLQLDERMFAVGSLSLCRHLLAAWFRPVHNPLRAWEEARCSQTVVCIWDVHTRDQLRTIELPSRRHAHFHRNVIVPNSVSSFGACLAMDDYRIALSACCKEGDWQESIVDEHGLPCLATSLLVVQEVGPEWARTPPRVPHPAPARMEPRRAPHPC